MNNNHGFWQMIWQEAEPIIAHAAIVLVLESSFLIIGLITWCLERLFPTQETFFSRLEKADIWLALALLWMFGFYTFLRVGIRLVKGIWEEIHHGKK